MTNGDESTRESTQSQQGQGAGGGRREPGSRPGVPEGSNATGPTVTDVRTQDPITDEPTTDELNTVLEVEAAPQPSVLPPDVAAARTAMHRRTTEIPIVDRSHPYGEDDDVDPLVDDDPAPEDTTPHAHRPHVVIERRAGLWFTISLLVVLLIGTSTLAAYLWHVSDEWKAQVEELTDVSYGLGADLADERETLVAAQERIDLLVDQLSTSKDTVSRLQAENARWGDDAEFAQEQITQLEDLVAQGSAATGSLTRCIEAHDQLITYLQAPEGYAPEEIEAFRVSVVELCTEATRVATEFRTAAAE